MPKGDDKTVAIVGCGTVGRTWALLFLRAGWRVRVFDPAPEAREDLSRIFQQVQTEIPAFKSVDKAALSFHNALSEVVQGAVWIQESAPDRIDLKLKIYQMILAHSSSDTLIASSSETLTSADIQAFTARAKYALVIRPLSEGFSTNQVAILDGPQSAQSLLIQVSDFLKSLGLEPQIRLD